MIKYFSLSNWQKWYNHKLFPKQKWRHLHHKHRGKTYSKCSKINAISLSIKDLSTNTKGLERYSSALNAGWKVIQFAKKMIISVIYRWWGNLLQGKQVEDKKEKAITNEFSKLMKVKHNIELSYYWLYSFIQLKRRFSEVLGLTWDCVLGKLKSKQALRPRKQNGDHPKQLLLSGLSQ